MLATALLYLFAAADPQVWIFVRTDCPISNRYAPTLEKLYREYSAKQFQFLLVYPEPGATTAAVEKHREEYRLTIPYRIDTGQEKVRRGGVQVTPEAVVFGPDGTRVYRGRIDDRQASLGVVRRAPVHNDLEDVLKVLAQGGKEPAPRTTKAFGCAIEAAPK